MRLQCWNYKEETITIEMNHLELAQLKMICLRLERSRATLSPVYSKKSHSLIPFNK